MCFQPLTGAQAGRQKIVEKILFAKNRLGVKHYIPFLKTFYTHCLHN
jgi:hypothetical protein